MGIKHQIFASIAQVYTFARHPESIALKRKGIKYDEYRSLNLQWIKDLNINTILDVGANIGQFAKLAREVFPSAKIYSFEPLPDCFEKLENALPGDVNFKAINCGIGSADGALEFFRSFHSPSSSFLQMEDLHREAFPETVDGQSKEPMVVKVHKLDDVLAREDLKQNLMVKLDVQGFEMEAIAGAQKTIELAKIVIVEMSFVKLYRDQPLFHDVYERMYNIGFEFRGALGQMLHHSTQEIVQSDAIFIRRS